MEPAAAAPPDILTITSEKQLMAFWRQSFFGQASFTTEEGTQLDLIYPGRLNDARGADLTDAVTRTGNTMSRGAIELHVRTSNWRSHEHHLNPTYNPVILHVVYEHDSPSSTREDGKIVPTLALKKQMGSIQQAAALPCHGAYARLGTEVMEKHLAQAGRARFMEHATRFSAEMSVGDGDQSLYRGIMEALGYSRNKEPFKALARSVPLRTLRETDIATNEALLFGHAGMLPSQRGLACSREEWVDRLEAIWSLQYRGTPVGGWCLYKIRPRNTPARRLAAAARLLARFNRGGLIRGLASLIQQSCDNDYRRLEEAIIVSDEGYWARHYDFNLPCQPPAPVLLGRARIRELIVNAILPFFYAWGQHTGCSNLARQALRQYERFPGLESNTLERHMRGQLGLSRLARRAYLQQGLIQIYKGLCSQGRCGDCPLHP